MRLSTRDSEPFSPMTYGYFDHQAQEYVITDPRTPAKWINYIGSLGFGGFVDHTGGALLCKGDPARNRITKYVQQQPDSEVKGTTLYLRIRGADGIRRVMSPFFVPGLEMPGMYECHVGLGYTRIVSELQGVRTDATIFVPPDEHVELRDITITNTGSGDTEIDVIPVVEFSHPQALMLFTNADWVPQTMVCRAIREPGGLCTLLHYPYMHRDTKVNYFSSNVPVSSFETDRERFLGRGGRGNWVSPAALVEHDELSSTQAHRGYPVGALLHHLGTLRPGESRHLITQLGQGESYEKLCPVIARYRDPVEIDGARGQLTHAWESRLQRQQVRTPDQPTNHMLSLWNPYQCFITHNWSRYLSYYQLGMGLRGIGFRDSAQDVLGIVHAAPGSARRLSEMLLSIQRPNGSAFHSVNPLSLEASIGESGERIDYYGDDHLWAVPAVCSYLKETGDYGFLEKNVAYRTGTGARAPAGQQPVLDHLQRALHFTHDNVGTHGLPLLGFADWNDSVNLEPGAESFFVACLYGVALLEMAELAEYLGDVVAASGYRNWHNEMRERVETWGWDGAWYRRYITAGGTFLGSAENATARIYLNAQSWPVMAGFASPQRGAAALDAAREHLNTSCGLKISTPGYNGFDPAIGGVSTYPPGAKENGGIFVHTNPWMVIAETMLGRGDRAFEYYRQINPAAKNESIDRYEVEPYVYAQNILGDEHPQFGLGRNSWLSGTAAWMYRAGTQHILGIRPHYNGLRIDPCIPSSWKGFTAERTFRGARYRITVHNPAGACHGVGRLTVDGEPVEGNTIPVLERGTHEVVATLGDRNGTAEPVPSGSLSHKT